MSERVCASLVVRVSPRAGRNSVDGWADDGTLKVRLTAAPADGKANAALTRLLAGALGVPPSSVTIVRGATARTKYVRIDGIDDGGLRVRLDTVAGG